MLLSLCEGNPPYTGGFPSPKVSDGKCRCLVYRLFGFYIEQTVDKMGIQYDVIKWKHFPRYWPFVRGIHRWPVNSPHKGKWCGALMFSLICAWKKTVEQTINTSMIWDAIAIIMRSLWRRCNVKMLWRWCDDRLMAMSKVWGYPAFELSEDTNASPHNAPCSIKLGVKRTPSLSRWYMLDNICRTYWHILTIASTIRKVLKCVYKLF